MQIEVVEEEDNTLLNRKELKVKVSHPAATPSRIEVRDKVAADLKVSPELVIVDNMKTAFGKKETAAYIKIYDSAEAIQQVEQEHILKRNKPPASQPVEGGEQS
jgi:small subunit ribosomal protein S24e